MRKKNRPQFPYDPAAHKSVIKCSICNDADPSTFMETYGITEVPGKIY